MVHEFRGKALVHIITDHLSPSVYWIWKLVCVVMWCGPVMWMPKWPCSSNICFRRKLERVYSRRADVTAGAGPQSSWLQQRTVWRAPAALTVPKTKYFKTQDLNWSQSQWQWDFKIPALFEHFRKRTILMPSVERYKSGKRAHATPYVNTVKWTRLVNFCVSPYLSSCGCSFFLYSLFEAKIQG